MFAIVGGYTTQDRDGRGNGINVFRIDPVSGAWTQHQHIGGLENPALFTLTRNSTRLYSVHGARKLVSAFAVDPASGLLTLINQVDCGGSNPVDSALDPSERFLVVANYGSGSVAVLPLAGDGSLQPVIQSVTLEGAPGPDPKEQTSSHPHAVIFDPSGRFVIVPDKGLDRSFVFHCDNGMLTPTEHRGAIAAPGAAPRHAAFHPALPALYVNNELNSTVTVYHWTPETGAMAERQVISTVAAGFTGTNTTAEIAASACGRFLYVSNRGQDSITQFLIAAGTGSLTYAGHFPTGGKRPRFFAIAPDSRHLYAANQDSDTINVFHINQATGSLIPTGISIAAGSPSAISFVPPT